MEVKFLDAAKRYPHVAMVYQKMDRVTQLASCSNLYLVLLPVF